MDWFQLKEDLEADRDITIEQIKQAVFQRDHVTVRGLSEDWCELEAQLALVVEAVAEEEAFGTEESEIDIEE